MKSKKQKNPFLKDYLYEDGEAYGLYAIEVLQNYPFRIEEDYISSITHIINKYGYKPYLYNYDKFFEGYIDILEKVKPFRYKIEKEDYYEQFGYGKVKPLLNIHILIYNTCVKNIKSPLKYKLYESFFNFIKSNLEKLGYIKEIDKDVEILKYKNINMKIENNYFIYNYSDFSDIDYYLKNLYTKPLK